MAQKTNLNISPYFDDFDSAKNFYKVLFNPGRPVQARELTTLQSILQNQVEQFGSHLFKEGSLVIPGNIVYDGQFYAIKLNQTNYGVDIQNYINNFVGKKITGESSGVTATVQKVLLPDGEDIEYVTLYVKYLDSDNDFNFSQFSDGESLVASENITYGVTTINSGTPFASLISSGANAIGSSASINDGVYFIRGFFARVSKQTLILDEYSNTPSYRIGLKVDEEIITAKDDSSLYDNAKGFSNYAAPGADRFKISLTLIKKSLDDLNDTDFVELMRVDRGKIKKIEDKTNYNIIRDYLAQRTYDESGDYSVDEFKVTVHNSLNDRLGNDGIFFSDEKTEGGNTPSDDLMCVKVSPGKAYVRGYDISKVSTTILDIDKPRDTQTIKDISIPFEMGNILRVNNVSGTPKVKTTIELYNQRKSSTSASTGTKIGDARVYGFKVTDSAFSGSFTNYDLYLYDIQTYTELTLNQALSSTELPTTSYVKGKSSGATGYAVSAGGGSTVISLRQTSGTFIAGEQITINGLDNVPRTIRTIKVYGAQDIRSIFQSTSVSAFPVAFTADAFLDRSIAPGFTSQDRWTIDASGNVTLPVSSAGAYFTGIKTDTIIRYQKVGFITETYNRVTSVAPTGTSMTVAAVPNVNGVCEGSLPASSTQITPTIGLSLIRNQENASLYAELPEKNISSVNLTSTNLAFNDQLTGQTTSASGVMTFNLTNLSVSGVSSAFFQPFNIERYSVFYSTGGIATVTSDQFTLSNNTVTISGLNLSQTNAVVNVSLLKNSIKSKIKTYNRSQAITVNLSKYPYSGTGINTSVNDGLIYNPFYGIRVQDEEICLNYPDVVKVISVLESLDENAPTLDRLSFSPTIKTDLNVIVGENIVGNSGNAIARVVSKPASNTIGIVYLNSNRFSQSESVSFVESNITTNIESITQGKYKDITSSFSLDKGQKDQYYDYSRIIRSKTSAEPSRQLYIVFDYYSVPSNDDGDVFTVLSYDKERYTDDIPLIGPRSVRATDTLDFRPAVGIFSGSSASPFDFSSRSFGTSPKLLLSPDETSLIGYDNYLGRIDLVSLDKSGNLILTRGNSSVTPKPPSSPDQSMDLASIKMPPYLYSPKEAQLSFVDNRRYTMRDIGKIEDRVENLERVTSLTLLELNTKSLQIRDAVGGNRFQSGFFVDDFKNEDLINLDFSSVRVNQDTNELGPVIATNSLKSQLAPASNITAESLDFSTNFTLLDPNVRKTGNVVTLNYSEVGWIEQPLATRVENVNPFHVVNYTGTISLSPESDNWVRTVELEPVEVTNVNETRLIDIISNPFENSRSRRRRRRGARFQARLIGALRGATITTGSVTNRDLVSSSVETYMRSRNTQFSAINLKPYTRFYQYLDGNSSVDFIPKLLEISPDTTLQTSGASGAFIVGETVSGTYGGNEIINFRVCKADHKSGLFNNPTSVYTQNPYSRTSIPSTYSASSPILNIDTASLSEEAQGAYGGYVVKGMKLIGQQSGTIAYVKDLRLITDQFGDLTGAFFLRDPNSDPPPEVRINTGTKTYKLTSSSTNEAQTPGSNKISFGETTYRSEGVVNVFQTTTTTSITEFIDPLAQSFSVGGNVEAPTANAANDDANGAFISAVDIYFKSVDSGNAPVNVEIRTVELGTVTRTRLGETVTKKPSEITTSDDASVPTKFVFKSPIYLAPGAEYAVVILAPQSDQYEVWIAEMGERVIGGVGASSVPSPQAARYTQQFAIGSLFKSQNGSIWTANQYQDLKFKLYKCKFVETGTAFFYNPQLDSSNSYVKKLGGNAIRTLPRRYSLGITTVTDSNVIGILTTGRKVSSTLNPYAFGSIVGTGSSTLTVGITTGGLGYTVQPVVNTFNITGNGSGLTLNVSSVTSTGAISGVSIVTRGNGYSVGDVVGIVTSSAGNTGRDARITIATIGGLDTLYLSNVQGQNFTSGAQLIYYDNSGNAVTMASTTITSRSAAFTNTFSGNYMLVEHFNHGMYSSNNKVKISNAQSNIAPAQLTSTLAVSGNSINIAVADTSRFRTFEGVSVASSNPGYALINKEIIKYESVGNGTLQSITRAQDSTIAEEHPANSNVYKYELNGVSLRRINKTHDIAGPIDIDSYYVQIDRTSNGVDRSTDNVPTSFPQVSFTDESNVGGNSISASENIQFDNIEPTYNIVTPGSVTSATASIRTVSGTSVNGSEASFIDQGFEPVQLNRPNPLTSTRIVCSKVNETTYLTDLPRNRSFTTGITFTSSDENVSPIIYTDTAFTKFSSNRINRPIMNYISDNRVNSLTNDPHAAVYVSNRVDLKLPANSLKVILAANRPSPADFRVLYRLIRPDSSEINQTFELFPGYSNLRDDIDNDGFPNNVINPANNDGSADILVAPSVDGEFLEYQFTADNLGQFTGYIIKIVMSSTNQAYPVKIKQLRSIATRL